MKDAIDIRDTKRHIASSVVKWWDVKYLTDDEDENDSPDMYSGYVSHSGASRNDSPKPVEDDFEDSFVEEDFAEDDSFDEMNEEDKKAQEMMNHMSDEDRQAAMDIIERLNREAFEDDLKKSMEIEMLKAEVQKNEEG
ncbi:MAG: hypothetical protein K6E56_07535 [Lachnospiraceae bacterium]|nr:hypothetical protein [Lachnospiraceae bacterium]